MQTKLPGDVLRALRTVRSHEGSPTAFACQVGWSYQVLYNYETVGWGVDPKKWRVRSFPRRAVKELREVGHWIEKGDKWHADFYSSFEWQAQVLRYGPVIYELQPRTGAYARLSQAQLREFASAAVTQHIADMPLRQSITEEVRVMIVDKVFEDLQYVLKLANLMGLAGRRRDVDVGLLTRGLLATGTPDGPPGPGIAETPLLRTLRFAHKCLLQVIPDQIAAVPG